MLFKVSAKILRDGGRRGKPSSDGPKCSAFMFTKTIFKKTPRITSGRMVVKQALIPSCSPTLATLSAAPTLAVLPQSFVQTAE